MTSGDRYQGYRNRAPARVPYPCHPRSADHLYIYLTSPPIFCVPPTLSFDDGTFSDVFSGTFPGLWLLSSRPFDRYCLGVNLRGGRAHTPLGGCAKGGYRILGGERLERTW